MKHGASPRLAVCGHTNLDVHLVVKELPKAGQSVAVVERRTHWGGTAANIAHHAAGLDVATRLWSRVGDDFPPTWRTRMEKAGVDLTRLETVAGANTPTCFILTDLADRQCYAMDQGPMGAMEENPPPTSLLEGMPKGAWLHLATGKPLAYAALAAQAREQGLHVALDPGQELRQHYDGRSLKGLAQMCDVLFLNDAELGVACDLLEAQGPDDLLVHVPNLVVTHGARGASLHRDGAATLDQPGFATRVVDPTGAGDALRAGWHAGLAAGKDMETALRWGQAAASLVIEHPGAQEYVVTSPDVRKRLAT